jgi:hypothetical protein
MTLSTGMTPLQAKVMFLLLWRVIRCSTLYGYDTIARA